MNKIAAVGLAAGVALGGGFLLEHGAELKYSWDSRHDGRYPAAVPGITRTYDENGPRIDQLDTLVNKDGFNGRVTATVYRNVGELVLSDANKDEKTTIRIACHSGALVLRQVTLEQANGEFTSTDGNIDLGQAVSCMPDGDQFSPTAKADVFLAEYMKGDLLATGLWKPAE